MRAFVFTDKALGRQAGRFVWLSINTEKKENAPVLAKYPVKVWPSFYVIDAAAEKIVFRWVGGATTPQMQHVLDDGAKAAGKGAASGTALADADRFYADAKYAEAAAGYRKALETLKPGTPSYPRVVESLLFALSSTSQQAACATLARDVFGALKNTPSAANVAGGGLDCALGMKDDDPQKAALVAALAADAREIVSGPKTGLAADDVSALFSSLADERRPRRTSRGRSPEEWASYLEGGREGETPSERTVFDAPDGRRPAGQPERACPHSSSPRRLSGRLQPSRAPRGLYAAAKKYDEALAASDRAMARVYGPRKLVVYARASTS